VPIYVDSPMALAALQIYREAFEERSADVRPELADAARLLDVPNLTEVFDSDGSKGVSRSGGPAIIIAGAGMASGGRVVHHLEKFLPDERCSVALVGFQAVGTRGRQLLDGASSVKIHGQYVRVKAEICDLTGFSVHADAGELMSWIRTADRPPTTVFVVHGEADASRALRNRIVRELDWNAVTPLHGERIVLQR
jgi:metallo-beta-lactamase family protein